MNNKQPTSEQDFLREKTKTLHEKTDSVIDVKTGEILSLNKTETKTVSPEPDYVKVYYRTMMAANDIAEIPLDFLLALSAQIGYANDNSVLFFNNKTTRQYIATFCGIKDNMVLKYINRCVEKGVLFKTNDRGTYEVNPWMIAKGRWENIRKLQANFSFTNGTWKRIIAEDPEGAAQPLPPVKPKPRKKKTEEKAKEATDAEEQGA